MQNTREGDLNKRGRANENGEIKQGDQCFKKRKVRQEFEIMVLILLSTQGAYIYGFCI